MVQLTPNIIFRYALAEYFLSLTKQKQRNNKNKNNSEKEKRLPSL